MPLDANQKTLNEKTTGSYTAYLRDSTGTVVPLASLSTLTLTLWNKNTEAIINTRDAQDVKNTNNVTYHATSGLLTWSIQTADTTLVDTTLAQGELEVHNFLFRWTTATDAGSVDDSFNVKSQRKVT